MQKLGSLVAGFKKDDIKRINDDAISDAMKTFNKYKDDKDDGQKEVIKELISRLKKYK